MRSKKNGFLLFVCSLFPGAGHMYLGFMKMGLSCMVGFLGSAALTSMTGVDALGVVPVIIYVYSFFHAHNIAGLDEARFMALPDEYLFGFDGIGNFKLEGKMRSIAAATLILLGLCTLWNVAFEQFWEYVGDNPALKAVYSFMRDDAPRILMALAVIWFGVSLLRGKKKEGAARIEQKAAAQGEGSAPYGQNMPGSQSAAHAPDAQNWPGAGQDHISS